MVFHALIPFSILLFERKEKTAEGTVHTRSYDNFPAQQEKSN